MKEYASSSYDVANSFDIMDEKLNEMRWFLLPHDALQFARGLDIKPFQSSITRGKILQKIPRENGHHDPKEKEVLPEENSEKKESKEIQEEDGFFGNFDVEEEENDKKSNGKIAQQIRPAKVPKNLIKYTAMAIEEFDMIKDGDRVMLGLSGGKVMAISGMLALTFVEFRIL
jgi:hypothetical protein